KATGATWNVNGANTGTVTNLSGTWTNMGSLTDLGSGNFKMNTGGTLSGSVVSTTATGTLDYSGRATAVNVNLAGTATNIGGTYSGIHTVVGSTATTDTVSGRGT